MDKVIHLSFALDHIPRAPLVLASQSLPPHAVINTYRPYVIVACRHCVMNTHKSHLYKDAYFNTPPPISVQPVLGKCTCRNRRPHDINEFTERKYKALGTNDPTMYPDLPPAYPIYTRDDATDVNRQPVFAIENTMYNRNELVKSLDQNTPFGITMKNPTLPRKQLDAAIRFAVWTQPVITDEFYYTVYHTLVTYDMTADHLFQISESHSGQVQRMTYQLADILPMIDRHVQSACRLFRDVILAADFTVEFIRKHIPLKWQYCPLFEDDLNEPFDTHEHDGLTKMYTLLQALNDVIPLLWNEHDEKQPQALYTRLFGKCDPLHPTNTGLRRVQLVNFIMKKLDNLDHVLTYFAAIALRRLYLLAWAAFGFQFSVHHNLDERYEIWREAWQPQPAIPKPTPLTLERNRGAKGPLNIIPRRQGMFLRQRKRWTFPDVPKLTSRDILPHVNLDQWFHMLPREWARDTCRQGCYPTCQCSLRFLPPFRTGTFHPQFPNWPAMQPEMKHVPQQRITSDTFVPPPNQQLLRQYASPPHPLPPSELVDEVWRRDRRGSRFVLTSYWVDHYQLSRAPVVAAPADLTYDISAEERLYPFLYEAPLIPGDPTPASVRHESVAQPAAAAAATPATTASSTSEQQATATTSASASGSTSSQAAPSFRATPPSAATGSIPKKKPSPLKVKFALLPRSPPRTPTAAATPSPVPSLLATPCGSLPVTPIARTVRQIERELGVRPLSPLPPDYAASPPVTPLPDLNELFPQLPHPSGRCEPSREPTRQWPASSHPQQHELPVGPSDGPVFVPRPVGLAAVRTGQAPPGEHATPPASSSLPTNVELAPSTSSPSHPGGEDGGQLPSGAPVPGGVATGGEQQQHGGGGQPASTASAPATPTARRRRRGRSPLWGLNNLFQLLTWISFTVSLLLLVQVPSTQAELQRREEFLFRSTGQRVIVNPSMKIIAREIDFSHAQASLTVLQTIKEKFNEVCTQTLGERILFEKYEYVPGTYSFKQAHEKCLQKNMYLPFTTKQQDIDQLTHVMQKNKLDMIHSPYYAFTPGSLHLQTLAVKPDTGVALKVDPFLTPKAFYSNIRHRSMVRTAYFLKKNKTLSLQFVPLPVTTLTYETIKASLVCENHGNEQWWSSYYPPPDTDENTLALVQMCARDLDRFEREISRLNQFFQVIKPTYIQRLSQALHITFPVKPYYYTPHFFRNISQFDNPEPTPKPLASGPSHGPLTSLSDLENRKLSTPTPYSSMAVTSPSDGTSLRRRKRALPLVALAGVGLGLAAVSTIVAAIVMGATNAAAIKDIEDKLEKQSAHIEKLFLITRDLKESVMEVAEQLRLVDESTDRRLNVVAATVRVLSYRDDFDFLTLLTNQALDTFISIVTLARSNIAHESLVTPSFLNNLAVQVRQEHGIEIAAHPKHITAELIRTYHKYYVILEFPIIDVHRTGYLFDIIPMPLFSNDHRYLPTNSPPVVVIMEKSTTYATLNPHEVALCRKTPFNCRTTNPIVSPAIPACGVPLYFNYNSTCSYHKDDILQPFYYTSGKTTWFSLPKSTQLTVHCNDATSVTPGGEQTALISGMNSFELQHLCRAETADGHTIISSNYYYPSIEYTYIHRIGTEPHFIPFNQTTPTFQSQPYTDIMDKISDIDTNLPIATPSPTWMSYSVYGPFLLVLLLLYLSMTYRMKRMIDRAIRRQPQTPPAMMNITQKAADSPPTHARTIPPTYPPTADYLLPQAPAFHQHSCVDRATSQISLHPTLYTATYHPDTRVGAASVPV